MMKEHRYAIALLCGLPLLGLVIAALCVMLIGTCGAGSLTEENTGASLSRSSRA